MDTDIGPRSWIAALRNSHERLDSLIRTLSDQQLQAPSYASEWSIAQVLSHLGSGAELAQASLTAALDGSGEVDSSGFPAVWDAWNAKDPRRQASDCLAADGAHVSRLEGLTDEELGRMRLGFFGMDLDATGVVRLRLAEHAVHTWDVAVALDPAAMVSPDAVSLLVGFLPTVAGFAGRPGDGGPFGARLRTADPDGDYALDVADKVALRPWPAQDAAHGAPAAGITLPSEALLRLVYGRLDPRHTPAGVSGDSALLDRVRAVFPGF